MVIPQAAVLKAGAAHPNARKRDMLQDVGASFVIASPTTASLFQDWARVLVVDDGVLEGIGVDRTAERSDVDASQRQHILDCPRRSLQLGRSLRVVQFSSYNFDISIQDHWTTLTRGGCICIPTEEERMNDISGAIQRTKVNWMALTSTVASLVDFFDVPTVKSIVLTGEVASSSYIQKWADKVNLNIRYGPAEATIYCSWKGHIRTHDYASDIGRPIASEIG
ncbi:hypothetical protein J3459_013741 [Metarhizium acridum]|nr:hypothetical protein J3459_013741 [Metarhizium acridum]